LEIMKRGMDQERFARLAGVAPTTVIAARRVDPEGRRADRAATPIEQDPVRVQ
jgi:hypothetical protein